MILYLIVLIIIHLNKLVRLFIICLDITSLVFNHQLALQGYTHYQSVTFYFRQPVAELQPFLDILSVYLDILSVYLLSLCVLLSLEILALFQMLHVLYCTPADTYWNTCTAAFDNVMLSCELMWYHNSISDPRHRDYISMKDRMFTVDIAMSVYD